MPLIAGAYVYSQSDKDVASHDLTMIKHEAKLHIFGWSFIFVTLLGFEFVVSRADVLTTAVGTFSYAVVPCIVFLRVLGK